jgi:hypothetical protein
MSELCTSCSKVLTAPEDVTEDGEPRWQPDEQLVPAILAGSRKRMADLQDNDRAWVVAGLGLAGLKAEDIAERLKCSLRLVRSIRALPLTKACVYAQTETTSWRNETRLATSALKERDIRINALVGELERARSKLSRLIDAHVVGTPSCGRCGTPWDKGNTYYEGTKRRCRNCNRLKQQAFRERRKAQDLDADRNPLVGYELPTILTVEGHEGELVIEPSETLTLAGSQSWDDADIGRDVDYDGEVVEELTAAASQDDELIEISKAGALPRRRDGDATVHQFPSNGRAD